MRAYCQQIDTNRVGKGLLTRVAVTVSFHSTTLAMQMSAIKQQNEKRFHRNV